MSRQPRRDRNPFTRRPAAIAAGKTMLIITEGAKTEPAYLKGLRDHLRLQAADIRVLNAEGSDPMSVVDYAVALSRARKREVRRGCAVTYDSVWAVFDTERADTNPRLADALAKAAAHKIKVALSNPCFEFWLLLHDEFTTRPFAGCDDVIRRIRDRHIPDFNKSNIPVERYIPDKVPDAVSHAGQCRRYHVTGSTDGNPSTAMDKLVREMNEATRSYRRILLKD